MNNISLTILMLVAVFGMLLWTRKFQARKYQQAYLNIIDDLKAKGAFKPETAVALSYSTSSMFHFGLKDYRTKTLKYLVGTGIVGVTDLNTYYLIKDPLIK